MEHEVLSKSVGEKFIITTDNFFIAPDGKQYRAVFGTVTGVFDSKVVLNGVEPNEKSTNWYVEIGNMIVAGCQIHYVIRTDKCNFNDVKDSTWGNGKYLDFIRATMIYKAD